MGWQVMVKNMHFQNSLSPVSGAGKTEFIAWYSQLCNEVADVIVVGWETPACTMLLHVLMPYKVVCGMLTPHLVSSGIWLPVGTAFESTSFYTLVIISWFMLRKLIDCFWKIEFFFYPSKEINGEFN